MEDLLSYYHLFTLSLVAFWLIIFFSREELRREMLILGVLAIFLMPLIFTINQIDATEVHTSFVQISFVDLIFTFSLAGIAGTVFHAIFGKHYHKLPRQERRSRDKKESIAQLWILRLFVVFLVFVWTVVLLNLLFAIDIPKAFLIASIMVAIYVVSHRHDLLADAIWSSALTAFVVFLSSVLASIFTTTDFSIAPIASSATFLGAPVDLLLWSAAAGLALGPLYEFIRTLEVK